MVELVQGEAGLEGGVEAHVVDALVHRLLDQQGRHGGQFCNALGVLERPLGELVLWHGAQDIAFTLA